MEAAWTWILSVGSGDGGLEAAIVSAGHHKICVTFHESREHLLQKYSHARTNLHLFETEGIEHYISVSAASLGELFYLHIPFDVVMFYFPHVGGDITQPAVLQADRQLICDFLTGASKVLAKDGEIHLAVKVGHTYDTLDVRSLFASHSLAVAHKLPVDKRQFPGYVHRLTNGGRGSVPDSGAQLYVLKRIADGRSCGSTMKQAVSLQF
jgi:hypothetical protein